MLSFQRIWSKVIRYQHFRYIFHDPAVSCKLVRYHYLVLRQLQELCKIQTVKMLKTSSFQGIANAQISLK